MFDDMMYIGKKRKCAGIKLDTRFFLNVLLLTTVGCMSSVRNLLKTDWLFLLLLTGSTVGHLVISEIGDTQIDATLGSIQKGESSIALQLIAATRPQLQPESAVAKLIETTSSVDRQQPEELPHQQPQEVTVLEEDVFRPESAPIQEVDNQEMNQRNPELLVADLALHHKPEAPSELKSTVVNSEKALQARPVKVLPVERKETTIRQPNNAPQLVRPGLIRSEVAEQQAPQQTVTTSPVNRTQTHVEFELDTVVADAPVRKGNSNTDVVVESMNGANTAPALDPGNALNRPPVFPQELVSRGVSGTVKLEVVVQPDGKVKSTRVVASTGSEKLDQIAQQAVAKWQFRPGLTNGQAATKKVIVPITFKIEKRRAGVLKLEK